MLSRLRKLAKWVFHKKKASQTANTESEVKQQHSSDVDVFLSTRARPTSKTPGSNKKRTKARAASPSRQDSVRRCPGGTKGPCAEDGVPSTSVNARNLDDATASKPVNHRARSDSLPSCGSTLSHAPPDRHVTGGGSTIAYKLRRVPHKLTSVMKTTLKKKKSVLSKSYSGQHLIDGVDVLFTSVHLRGHLHPHDATDARPPEVPVNYWRKRYFLFSRFDEGIVMDAAAWFETTPEVVAAHIAGRLSDYSVICDGTAGVGGNAIQFARHDTRVECVDIDEKRLQKCSQNAEIYGVRDHLKFHAGDFCTVPPVAVDAVFLSPPWGGPECFSRRVFSLDPVLRKGCKRPRDDVTCDIPQMFARATLWSRTVVLFLPHHTDLRSLSTLARKHGYASFEAEKISYQLGGKTHFKILAAYFGHPHCHSSA